MAVTATTPMILAACGGAPPQGRMVPCPGASVAVTPSAVASAAPSTHDPVEPSPASPPRPPSLRMVPQLGHTAPVRMVRYSRDGKVVFSCADDRTVKVWDAETGALLRTLDEHASRVTAVEPLPDGVHVLSGTDKGELDLWDYTTGERVRQLEAQSDWVADIAVSADGKLALTGNRGQPAVWDLVTGRRLRRMSTQGQPVPVVGFTPSGPIAITAPKQTLEIYDLDRMTKVRTIDMHVGPLPARLSPDGTRLVVSSWNAYQAWVFDTRTWAPPQTIPVQAEEVVAGFSQDGALMATGRHDGLIALWDMRSGQRIRTAQTGIRYYPDPISTIDVSPDGHRWAIGTTEQWASHVEEYDADSGDRLHVYQRGHGKPTAVAIGAGGKTAFLGSQGDSLSSLNLETGALGPRLPAGTGTNIYDLAISADGTRLVEGDDSNVRLWDVPHRSHRDVRQAPGLVRDVSISQDGRRAACSSWDHTARVYDFDTGDEVGRFGAKKWTDGGDVRAVELTRDGASLLWAWQSPHATDEAHPSLRLMDVASGATVREYAGVGAIWRIRRMPDGDHFLTVGDRMVLWSLGSAQPVATIVEGSVGVAGLGLMPDGDRVLATSGPGELTLWNLRTRTAERTYHAEVRGLGAVDVTSDGKHAVTTSADGAARIWNLENGQSAAFIASGADWLIYTDDGYFDASRRGQSLLAVVDGVHAYEVDQIAARNNRPDLVLQRIGLGTPALLEHFAAQHRRRLERMGLDERASASPFAGAPSVRILDVDSNRNRATVTFEATAHGAALASYHLFVNEVPVLGLGGAPLAGDHQQTTAQVELTPGRNRIEISARSVDGVESLREYRTVELDQKARPDLYVLAFGVSHYKNPAYDLSYAHKDAIDLASVLASMEGRSYGQVFTRLLTDGEVTVDALREAKARLSQARPEDVLVVQVAGHGMYDRDSEYYFLTHEVDLTRLAQTAAPFELIEELVQDVPPRQKLLLLDACNSGDRDPSTSSAGAPMASGARGIRSRGVRALWLDQEPQARAAERPPEFPDRDRYIYADLLRRSGAVVFSSSRGDEYSYESDALQNGAFTSAILRALTTKDADRDGDGAVSVDELRTMVADAVAQTTNGAQHPTVDQDNTTVQFGFPIARDVRPKIQGVGNLGQMATGTDGPDPAAAPPKLCLEGPRVPHACGCRAAGYGGPEPYALALVAAVTAAWRRRSRRRD
jgi:MYXO-CTERM domain-containing protein